jgi:hypothetical protein
METEPISPSAAVATRQGRRFEQLHRAGLELAAISEASQLGMAYAAVLAIVAAENNCHAVLRRYDPEARELVLVGDSGPRDHARIDRIPLAGLHAEVARERQSAVAGFGPSHDSIQDLQDAAPNDRSMVVTPILFEANYYGNLAVSHWEINYFRDFDIKLIEGMALQLGITIHRTEEIEAHRAAERRAAESEALSLVGHQTYEIAHRLGNALGLVPRRVRKIKDSLARTGEIDLRFSSPSPRLGSMLPARRLWLP